MRRTLQLLAATAFIVPSLVGATTAESVETAQAQPQAQATEKVAEVETVNTRVPAGKSTTIEHPGAFFVRLHFSEFKLNAGDVLTVSSEGGTETRKFTADLAGNTAAARDGNGFWALSVSGDTAKVSLTGADGGAASAGSRVTVDKMLRGFTAAEFAEQAAMQPESICGTKDFRDVACYQSQYPTEYGKAPAVAKIIMANGSSCTAWRVGPNNRMLTNNHCFASKRAASTTEAWFNYQCPTCGGSGSAPVTRVFGSQLLKTDRTLDYTLYTLADPSAVSGFGYLSIDNRQPAVGEEMYIIGHPAGGLKKLSIVDDQSSSGICKVFDNADDGNAVDSDVSYKCDTEGGSSGSPVLSRVTGKVIALHHFGGCPNSGARMDKIYPQISSLL